MKTNQAKKIIKDYLDNNSLQYSKLTARTVDFSDLARGSKLFIKIHGWKADSLAGEICRLAKENGFSAEFSGSGIVG